MIIKVKKKRVNIHKSKEKKLKKYSNYSIFSMI